MFPTILAKALKCSDQHSVLGRTGRHSAKVSASQEEGNWWQNMLWFRSGILKNLKFVIFNRHLCICLDIHRYEEYAYALYLAWVAVARGSCPWGKLHGQYANWTASCFLNALVPILFCKILWLPGLFCALCFVRFPVDGVNGGVQCEVVSLQCLGAV